MKEVCVLVFYVTMYMGGDCGGEFYFTRDAITRRCFNCDSSINNSTVECKQPTSVQCPSERPYCGTTASLSRTAEDLSSLICVAPTGKLCSLRFIQQKQTYQITCACETDLCNDFFSKIFLQQLLDFTSKDPNLKNEIDPTDALLNAIQINENTIYEARSSLNEITTFSLTTMKQVKQQNSLQTDPLKQYATAPLDDDKDKGESSGDSSVSAAPSSFLSYDDEDENEGSLSSEETTSVPDVPNSADIR